MVTCRMSMKKNYLNHRYGSGSLNVITKLICRNYVQIFIVSRFISLKIMSYIVKISGEELDTNEGSLLLENGFTNHSPNFGDEGIHKELFKY